MTAFPIAHVVDALTSKGVIFESGLAAGEIRSIEQQYGFHFPPDLSEFLAMGLPVSDDFPNWRTGKIKRGHGNKSITELIDWPAEGMCFDIEHNGFWMRDWGPRTDDLQESFQIARRMVKGAPFLVPVYSHRFLPADPAIEGNPVLSVYQTDIIYYGLDLVSYLANEFELPLTDHGNGNREPRRIRFWSDVIDTSWNEGNPQQGRVHKN